MTKMMPKAFRAAGAALALTLCLPATLLTAAAADEVPVNAETVAVRIDLAGRQRMLTERMAKAFCYARSNVDAADSVAQLTKAMNLFGTTHAGFRQGDTEMRLFAEKDPSVSKAWSKVNIIWMPLKSIYDLALQGGFVDEAEFEQVVDLTLEQRSRANDMVAQLRASYAKDLGGSGFGDAILLDLYGRQRMLSQKLSKEVCLVARGYKPSETPAELNATLELFENSLAAFIEGMPIAGVPKPPTAEIAAQLAKANTEWQQVRFVAATVSSGGAATLAELAQFKAGADRFLVEMNKAVKMLAATKALKS